MLLASPLLLMAVLSIALFRSSDLLGLWITGGSLVALVLTSQSPPSALIRPRVAVKILGYAVLPTILWSIFLWTGSSSQIFVVVLAKIILSLAVPLIICTRWSLMHVIALLEVVGMRAQGHELPAVCERSVFNGPFWLAEANELEIIFRVSRTSARDSVGRIQRLLFDSPIVVLQLVEAVGDVVDGRKFQILGSSQPVFQDLPYRASLIVIFNIMLASLVIGLFLGLSNYG